MPPIHGREVLLKIEPVEVLQQPADRDLVPPVSPNRTASHRQNQINATTDENRDNEGRATIMMDGRVGAGRRRRRTG